MRVHDALLSKYVWHPVSNTDSEPFESSNEIAKEMLELEDGLKDAHQAVLVAHNEKISA